MDDTILRYDLITQEASMVDNKAAKLIIGLSSAPMTIQDGGMAVGVSNSKMFLLSMVTNSPKGDISWKKIREIDLNNLSPVKDRLVNPDFFAFVPALGILVATLQELFCIDLKSDEVEVDRLLQLRGQEVMLEAHEIK
ncbi:hypothetical protein HU200_015911 [Digitaria exilis]|uniref:Uncharacterized protein n=1 Tax=Digitaria exilis TaxID=1010633 RepID=A0A835F9F3_9POAL|nr:hypothetical protein HU200_015911 [Digitaria exilis]